MISQLVQYAVDRLSYVELTPKSNVINHCHGVAIVDVLEEPTTV
jgi:hypothetical protein